MELCQTLSLQTHPPTPNVPSTIKGWCPKFHVRTCHFSRCTVPFPLLASRKNNQVCKCIIMSICKIHKRIDAVYITIFINHHPPKFSKKKHGFFQQFWVSKKNASHPDDVATNKVVLVQIIESRMATLGERCHIWGSTSIFIACVDASERQFLASWQFI